MATYESGNTMRQDGCGFRHIQSPIVAVTHPYYAVLEEAIRFRFTHCRRIRVLAPRVPELFGVDYPTQHLSNIATLSGSIQARET